MAAQDAPPQRDEGRNGSRLVTLLELGIAPGSVSAETLRRVRVVSLGTLGVASIALLSALQYALFGVVEGALALAGTAALAIANLELLRHTRRATLAAHLGLTLLAGIFVGTVVMGGGFERADFTWVLLLPVAAAVATDLRGALVWGGVGLLILAGFYALAELGVGWPSRIPDPLHAAQLFFDRVTAMLGLGALTMGFIVAQRRAERDLAHANQELRGETGLVQLLTHGAMAANEALSLREALRDCVAGICDVMGWAGGQAYLLNEAGELEPCEMGVRADESLEALLSYNRGVAFGPGDGLPGRVLRSGGAEAVRDLRRAPPFSSDAASRRRSLARRAGVVAAVAAPIRVSGKVVGVIEFASREPLPAGDRVLEVLTLLGVQLGRVAERENLQDRLRQAQKIEAIGQLAAGLAHEINNPMAYVRTNLNVLRAEWEALRKELDAGATPSRSRLDECADLLDECNEGVDRTVAIVRDVKEFSHAGKAQWEWVDLNAVVDAAVRVASSQARDGIEISCTPGEMPTVRGSPSQLRQVFLNLVVNAIQAVGQGGRITLSSFVSGEHAVVRVEDDGPGVAPAALERLFEPFFTTKPVGEGTGLGLYVSYEIVRNHGGELRVENTPGARFEVRLPLER